MLKDITSSPFVASARVFDTLGTIAAVVAIRGRVVCGSSRVSMTGVTVSIPSRGHSFQSHHGR